MSLRRRLLAGLSVAALGLTAIAAGLEAAAPKDRTISFRNIHTDETITVQYMKDGRKIPAAMDKINGILRDHRKNEPATMDPDLIDLLWEIHAELGSQQPINIISGYRSRATNEMLRRTVGGQASESRHILGKAADVFFPDVPLKKLRYSALIRERGGVGYYPTSGTPFVHIDTDRVRHWPRLPRLELALLFQNGKSQHVPADGTPITPDDVRVARTRHQDLAVQVAEFMGSRRDLSGATTLVADAGVAAKKPAVTTAAAPAPAPAQVASLTPPKQPNVGAMTIASLIPPAEPAGVVDRSSTLTPRSTSNDSWQLGQLAAGATLVNFEPKLVAAPQPVSRTRAIGPTLASLSGAPAPIAAAQPETKQPAIKPDARVAAIDPATAGGSGGTLTDAGLGSGWVQAPAYDEEHPEELSYRPFPIAPYLTATASADDPALVTLTHPDVAKTLELLDQAGAMPEMRLRPGQQVAETLWAQQFKGPAIKPDALAPSPAAQPPAGIAGRKVKTTSSE